MKPFKEDKFRIAIWALTPKAALLGRGLKGALLDARLHLGPSIPRESSDEISVSRLRDGVAEYFGAYEGHIFIMATGIVVRMIARLIRHKTVDPAVVVLDEAGEHAISLLSGHLGGANRLARTVAHLTGARPVITTATDVNSVPAADTIAAEKGLFIENPEAIKGVNMALITNLPLWVHDPARILGDDLAPHPVKEGAPAEPGIFVDDILVDLPAQVLILRPLRLVAGMGCNRGTSARELKELLTLTLKAFSLSISSLYALATIDIKRDEPGLIQVSSEMGIPLIFFDRDALNQVKEIQRPSAMVQKHIGVKSVCEASAILGAQNGPLIVPKQKSPNATLAVARADSPLSASDPATENTSQREPQQY